MNRKMIFYLLGRILVVEAVLMLLPLTVCLIYLEQAWLSFAITSAAALLTGIIISRFFKPKNAVIFAKEGFVIVSLAWIVTSAVGAVPFVISGEIPSYVDAFFETVSGFTTTGASILTNVEAMGKGMLFWRSFTHWIGGMGVLVFVMAITKLSDRPIHIMRAEMPGPIVSKLLPKAKDTAKILYIIYIGMTALEILFLVCGKMPLYEAVVHSFGTAGTGGFGVKADSIAGYSPYLQWVICVFMFLFGVNFNIYYLLLIKHFRSVIKSSELWVYTAIAVGSAAVVAVNVRNMYGTLEETIRASAFQVSSIMTTTGYATTDFDAWPQFSKVILILLMFIGASAGSTGGGLKVSRIILLTKMIRRELVHMLHPRSVKVIRFEGKKLDEATVSNVSSYFAVYAVCFFAVFLVLSADGYDMETNFSAAAACYNNIGPGFRAVGPALNYSGYSPLSKITLSAAMLFGRLEIFPMLLTFAPATWTKR